MEGSRQGAFNELDEPKAAVGGPGTSAEGPGTSALPFVMPGKTQCVPIYWFRHSCLLIGILENSVIAWPIVTVRSEGSQHSPNNRPLGVALADEYELMISGKGFNNAKNEDEVICRFKFKDKLIGK